jgi:bifunctional DNase/RNase
MKKIQLDIVALSHSITQSHNYAVVLGERHGSRRLPIVIGGFEAQAIAVAMERMTPNRPLTHDLFKNVLITLDINLKEIIINDLKDGIFFSQLICYKEDEKDAMVIDSRTSDALAMAVRFECPIYTYETVLDLAGVEMEETEEEEDAPKAKAAKRSRKLSSFSMDELIQMLNQVLTEEDYEKAADIRDEIKRREEK